MSKPLSRLTALVASAALAVSLSACTASGWQEEAPPAAGAQTDVGGLKLRNFMIVSDEAGDAIVAGGITSRDEAAEVVGISVAPQAEDGSFGTAQTIAYTADLAKGATVTLDGADTLFSDPALILGRNATITVAFADGQSAAVEAPVYSSEHPDFAEEWSAAQGAA